MIKPQIGIVSAVCTASFLFFAAPGAIAPVSAQGALEEVIVTARKREESLLDVPLSLSAISAGDIEGAKEQFAKASGVTEEDPRIARGLADIEIVRADLAWLHLRLLPPDSPVRPTIEQSLEAAIMRAENVGFVFQSFHLVPSLNALENVMLPLELAGARDAREKSMQVIEQVGLIDRWRHYPAQLSGGEKQRVAIARAFAIEPAVMFADEPTGNLDSRTGATIMQLMFDLNRDSSTTLVLVTHDNALAQRCERVLSLDVGRLVSDEPTSVLA